MVAWKPGASEKQLLEGLGTCRLLYYWCLRGAWKPRASEKQLLEGLGIVGCCVKLPYFHGGL